MACTNTVAIIGANSTVGILIAKSIVANYRLLLMDTEQQKLVLVRNEMLSINKNAEVEILHCCKNASWEADIIVVTNDGNDFEELAIKMAEVTNCKTILHFTSREEYIDKLQQLLPYAKVVTIFFNQSFTNAYVDAYIRGTDEEAMDTAKKFVTAMTCQPQTS